MNPDEQAAGWSPSVNRGEFLKTWLWLWFASFAGLLAVALLLELAAGESIRRINYQTQLFQMALVASVLTGLVWTIWMLRYHDEGEGKPILLLLLGATLGFIFLASLFYTVENFRGKRSWLKCFHTSVARGEKLTLAELAPPSVPDDGNFAMQPIWIEAITAQMGPEKARSWYGNRVEAFSETNKARPLDLNYELPEVQAMTNHLVGMWQLAKLPDLTAWQDYYRQLAQRTNYFPVASHHQSAAEAVLLALSRSTDTIEALRAASQLPHARFPVSYGDANPAGTVLPHLAMLKQCVSFLQLRVSAELQAGQTEAALEDIKLMLRLNDLVCDEPFLISHLVHIAMFQIEVQVIWQGLAEQLWSEPQLARMNTWLGQTDFLKNYSRAMAGEKAFGCQIVGYLEKHRREAGNIMGELFPLPGNLRENETLVNCLRIAMPRGWFDQNRAAIWRYYEEQVNHLISLEQRTYSTSNAAQVALSEARIGSSPSPYNRVTVTLIGGWSNAAKKFVFAQNSLDFARIALALERFRLANGTLPPTLDALSPRFLVQVPRDVISGEQLRYRPTENGGFSLYSVGWNQTDDGGQVSQMPSGAPNPKAGDWVWRYPDSRR